MVLANMAAEMGAKNGYFPPDEKMKFFFIPGVPSEKMLKDLIQSAREKDKKEWHSKK